MEIHSVADIEEFCEMIDKCEGQVELVTSTGDRLNLNSKISQYVAITKIFSEDDIPDIEIIAKNPEDEKRIMAFFENNK